MQQISVLNYFRLNRRTDSLVMIGIIGSYLAYAVYLASKAIIFKDIYYLFLFILSIILLSNYRDANRSQKKVLFFGFLILLGMAITGMIRQNFLSYFLQDLSSFSILFFVLVFNQSNSRHFPMVLINIFSSLLFVGVIIFIISLLNTKFILTTSRFDRSSAVSDALFNPSETITLVHFGPILIFFYQYLKKWQVLTAVLSCVIVLLFGLLTATRITIVIGILPLLYYAYTVTKKNLLRFSVITAIVIFPLAILFYGMSSNPVFRSAVLRFEMSDNYSSYRNDELEGFVGESSLDEYIWGRGLGGSHYFGIWKDFSHTYGMNMAHFGFVHLFLKGGLILMIFIYITELRALSLLFKRRTFDPLSIPFMFTILVFLTYEISHTRFLDPYYLIFLFSSISYSLNFNER